MSNRRNRRARVGRPPRCSAGFVRYGRSRRRLRAHFLPRATARSTASSLTSSDGRTVGRPDSRSPFAVTLWVGEGLRCSHGHLEIFVARFDARGRISVRLSDRPTVRRRVGADGYAAPDAHERRPTRRSRNADGIWHLLASRRFPDARRPSHAWPLDADAARPALLPVLLAGRSARQQPAGNRQLDAGGCEPPTGRRPPPAPRHAQRRTVDRRRPALPVAGPVRGVLPGGAAARSPAPPRPVHGVLGSLRAAGRPKRRGLTVRRAGRRAGGRAGGFSSSALGGG